MKFNLTKTVTDKDGNSVRKLNLKLVGGIAAGVLLLIIILVVSSFNGSKVDYWNTMNSIFSSELGTFRYVFDVRTAPKGELISVKTDESISLSQLNDIDLVGDEEKEQSSNHEFKDWNDSAVIRTQEWKYPNYQVIVDGCTTSLEPYTTQFTVSIATEYYNSKFTEFISFEGNYYIDIEAMRNWYLNSGDSYLVTFAENIPEGIRYLVVPEKEFGFISGYAEADELAISKTTGVDTMYRKLLVLLNSTNTIIKDTLGDRGYTSTANSCTVDLSTGDCWELVSVLKPYLSRGDVFYTSLVNAGKDKGLYTDEQYTQAMNERDNFLAGLYDANEFLSTSTANNFKTKIEGFCRTYTNGSGNQCLEGKLKLGVVTEENDYLIQVEALRSGNGKTITVPQGSQMKYADLNNKDLIQEKFFNTIDYFNFTPVDFTVQLNDTVGSISTDLLYKFIDIVNERGCYPYYLRMSNVNKFIEKYANYELTSDSTKGDEECMKLVADFYNSLNNITGGVVKYEEVVVEDEVERYPELVSTIDGVELTFTRNAELSTANMLVLDVELLNKSDSTVSIDFTKLACRDLLNSIVPANNSVIIQSHDSNFDVTSLVTNIDISPKMWDTAKLYFVFNTTEGHVDLYYNDAQLGAVIEY